VPLGQARPAAVGRPGRYGRARNERAARSAYTLILGAVLVVGVVALFFAVTWVLGSSGSSGAATPTPQPAAASPLPGPAPISSPPPFLVPSPSPSPASALAPPQQRFHVVEGGDTLNRIAQRYGVTVEAIMQANGFTDRNRILRIGERLVIPDNPPGSPVPR
jgi:LysM repeat protein